MKTVNKVAYLNDLAQRVEKHKRMAIKLLLLENKKNTGNYSDFDKSINNRLVDGLSLNSKMIKRILELAEKLNPIPEDKRDLVILSLATDQPPYYNDFGQAFAD